ncbi:hypothetical protein D3C78_1073650 [compost metagenome]
MRYRPVVPDITNPVANLRAAERKILEIAGETVEVFARVETPDLDVQLLIQEFLLQPQLREPPGLTPPPHLLHGTEHTCTGVADAIVAQVATAALSNCQFELCITPSQDLFKVHVQAQCKLVGVAYGLVVVVTTADVRRGGGRVE